MVWQFYMSASDLRTALVYLRKYFPNLSGTTTVISLGGHRGDLFCGPGTDFPGSLTWAATSRELTWKQVRQPKGRLYENDRVVEYELHPEHILPEDLQRIHFAFSETGHAEWLTVFDEAQEVPPEPWIATPNHSCQDDFTLRGRELPPENYL